MNTRYLDKLKQNAMTLIVSLPVNDPELARIAWEEGADAVKAHLNVDHHASKTHYGSFAEERPVLETILAGAKGPCGIMAGADLAAVRRDYRACAEAGFEFVSLYIHHIPPELLVFEGLIRMIALDHTYTPAEAKGLGSIGGHVLEASIARGDSYGEALSAREILAYRELHETSGLPVVVPTQKAILPEELTALAAAGIAGIMIGAVVTGKAQPGFSSAIAAFRKAIDRL